MNLIKPEKCARVRYDYHECSKYLETKYGYDERDYAGKFKYEKDCKKKVDDKYGDNDWYNTRPDDATPEQKEAIDYYSELMKNQPSYQDFWHFIIDSNDIHNGCEFTMHKDYMMEDAEPWQKEILQHYFDEFDADGIGYIEFYVWW